MIVIVDYGSGNIGSIRNMFKKVGIKDSLFSSTPEDILAANKLILPGVGSFDNGMKNLQEKGLIEILNKKVIEQKTPILGICLGMQLLTKSSEEGTEKGLGWIDAKTVKFQFKPEQKLKIPHMGWNYVTVKKENSLIDVEGKKRFYFVHSYYVQCTDPKDVLAQANYHFDFTCMLQKDQIWGAQFHPEKSHKFGMKLFENFAKM